MNVLSKVSRLLLNVKVINLSASWLVNLFSQSEVTFTSLLRRDDLNVVHVDLVDSVVELGTIQHIRVIR